ncbi:MAG TPA: DeoR/GlpR transcriptional regulator [Firmicutes bacterium]|nr:DeoR/GlpR transcriptional regulator [Bacillota bacterium]
MYVQERQREICSILQEEKRVSVKDLSKRFGVSDATIRRDINSLHERGLLVRTHGGAIPSERMVFPQEFKVRKDEHPEVKDKLAATAAAMVKPFDTLMIDSGTTTLRVVNAIMKRTDLRGLTIITNSIRISLELAKYPEVKGILIGGNLAPQELATQGPLSLNNIEKFKATKTIIGISGIDLEFGLTDGDEYSRELKEKMLYLGEEKIVVADSSKFGRIASYSLAGLNEVDTIITDNSLDERHRKGVLAKGVNLITV